MFVLCSVLGKLILGSEVFLSVSVAVPVALVSKTPD